MQLKAGEHAPGFTLPDADMESVTLADYRGKRVVLFFYPKDGTPGCTVEATDFSDHEPDFSDCNCVLFGISRDDCLTHAEFRDKEGIGVALLADTEGEVCSLYRVLQAKEVDGQTRYCVARSTFIIDGEGVIRHALYNVNFKGHALDVLRLVKELDS
ncbi:MAG TPA: peroxiredoxin [Rhodocyclaceae bacterium]|jgi:peroxiredoxin Q/BCP|nr:peroxiredoxin [Rhodocyclaceae bacterium]HMW77302.1 peroxiredoxin [Rhodocyclaceae bacterium]HNE43215.1 peroxiredoxin [Rhodocyclaceae bacterium]HNL21187.1 peroxiredoxin [Rhodocyclaceae bacterium]HNM23539.1 peroxiredoxin [Rhodocyclaceae bacterium]